VAQERVHLNEDLAQDRFESVLAPRHCTREIWRWKAIWRDQVSVKRLREKRRKWVFRYPNEKWNTDCVEPTSRRGERGNSHMMTGFFMVKLMVFFYLFFLILLLLGVELLECQLLMSMIIMTF